jgi:hypothetical protein
VSEWRTTAEWDWTVLGNGDRLHAVAVLDNEATADDDWYGVGITACARRGEMRIPGVFERMSLERCGLCCVRTGMPFGAQSPKNAKACRPVVEERLAQLDLSAASNLGAAS